MKFTSPSIPRDMYVKNQKQVVEMFVVFSQIWVSKKWQSETTMITDSNIALYIFMSLLAGKTLEKYKKQ